MSGKVLDENDKLIEGKLPSDPKSNVVPLNEAARTKLPALQRYGVQSIADLMMLAYMELTRPKPRRGAPTGNADLDFAIGGFRKGNITVFGAKRGFGKTSFGIQVADIAVMQECNVLSFAGEDPAIMYGKRFLARRANINAMRLRDLEVPPEELPRAARAVTDAPKAPFFLRTEGRPVEWVAKVIEEIAKEHPLDLVIVDYLQCIRAKNHTQDRRNEVTHVFQTLGRAIRGVNAAGLLFSQLKRTDRVRPEIEDLKESGDIEDGADHVLLGWKQEDKDGHERRYIAVAKNKDGVDDIDDIVIPWDAKTAAFKVTDRRTYSDPKDEAAAQFADEMWEGCDPNQYDDWRNR